MTDTIPTPRRPAPATTTLTLDKDTSAKLLPLREVLKALPRPQSQRPGNGSPRRRREMIPANGIRTVIPSSSARTTIEDPPSPTTEDVSQTSSPNFLRSIASTPRIPSVYSLPQSRSRVPSFPDLNLPAPSAPSSSVPPQSSFSAPFALHSRPPSELEWFSPLKGSASTPLGERPRGGEGGGGGLDQSGSIRSKTRSNMSSSRPGSADPRIALPTVYRPVVEVVVNSQSRLLSCQPDPAIVSRTIYRPINEERYTRQRRYSSVSTVPNQGPNLPDRSTALNPRPALAQARRVSSESKDVLLNGQLRSRPQETKPSTVHPTLWEDQLAVVVSIEVNGHVVARRIDNNWINCTKLLNAAGLSREQKDVCLKSEMQRHVVRRGTSCLKGVWLPLEAARKLAERHRLEVLLFPLFASNIVTWLLSPHNRSRTALFLQACWDRQIVQEEGDRLLLQLLRNRGQIVASNREEEESTNRLLTNAELDSLRRRRSKVIDFLEVLENGLKRARGSLQVVASRIQTKPSLPVEAQYLASVSLGVLDEEEEEEDNAGEKDQRPQARPQLPRISPTLSDILERPTNTSPSPRLATSTLSDPSMQANDQATWFENATPVSPDQQSSESRVSTNDNITEDALSQGCVGEMANTEPDGFRLGKRMRTDDGETDRVEKRRKEVVAEDEGRTGKSKTRPSMRGRR
ncbi:KilA-N domain-containing protein [Sporobolomyces salmoneus]|uniref:KilA-N domain-containing protein n=1 Tax=Sporobolomyces salmoneus TaxID=183962 RepID=UPI003175CBDF